MTSSATDWFADLFTDALIEIINKFTGFSLDIVSLEPDENFADIISLMSLNGKNGGTLFLSANESDMQILCSYMLGLSEAEVTRDDMEDALCELVNMTAGGVKLRLGSADNAFTLSTPFVMRGEHISLSMPRKVRMISALIGNGEISVKLKMLCANYLGSV